MCTACLAASQWGAGFHKGGDLTGSPAEAIGTPQTFTGDQNIDGVMSGTRWSDLALTYSFPNSSSVFPTSYEDTAFSNVFGAITATMETAARTTFAMLTSLTNLSFTELPTTTGSASVDITLAQSNTPSTAYAYYPSNSLVAGDVWFGRQFNYTQPVLGDYAYFTMIHELGHSMGLRHGHELGPLNGNGDYVSPMATNRDSQEFSIMTYRSYVGASTNFIRNEDFGFAQTYMMYDIAALQTMYGADYTTNSGNTVYTFDSSTGQMFVNGAGQGLPGGNRVFRTLWDGGGDDTYNFSNYTGNQSISLVAGGWSSFSATQLANLGDGNISRGNLFNALVFQGNAASLIENAICGSGNDNIRGNEVANQLTGNGGNDTLVGQGGNDTLMGGQGGDVLYGDEGPVAPVVTTGVTVGTGGFTSLNSSATNYSLNTALELTTNFSLSSNPYIENATSNPHTTVRATCNSQAAWYRVTLNASVSMVVDIDRTTSGALDSYVRILAADGITQLAFNDDNGSDPGSTQSLDSLVRYTTTTSGVFYIVVGRYGSPDTLPSFGFYDMHVSVSVTQGDDVLSSGLPNVYGNDLLDGGTGNDTLYGGLGNDIYVIDSAGDVVIEQGVVSETDTLRANFGTLVIPDFVEILEFVGYAGVTNVTGNAMGNLITGTISANVLYGLGGADTLIGNAGIDLIDGGTGADTMVGGANDDYYYVDNAGDVIIELAGEGFDYVYASASFTNWANVEYVIATGGAVLTGTGNGDANTFDATTRGLGVTLLGLGGADVFYGSNYADSIDGGDDNDIIVAYLSVNGADTLVGGNGDDVYYLFESGDVIIENAGVGSGFDTLYTQANLTLAANVEQAVVYGAATTITGNSGSNNLFGLNSGQSLTLDGGAGNDWAMGSNQNDTLIGGADNDILQGLLGANRMEGGTGDDVYYSVSTTDVVVELNGGGRDTVYASYNIISLAANVEQLVSFGGATIGNGNSSDNTLYGNNNTVGMTLDGGDGADLMFGSNLADTIIGGLGNDIMVGGTGVDRFAYTASGNMGADTIIDFTDGSDLINLAGRGYSFGINFTVADASGSTLITFGTGTLAGTTITLAGVAAANVTAADFVFV